MLEVRYDASTSLSPATSLTSAFWYADESVDLGGGLEGTFRISTIRELTSILKQWYRNPSFPVQLVNAH
jgi:hypothetical protein